MAGQQGKYLAKLFASNNVRPEADLSNTQPFRYSHAGSTAYVGSDRAVFDLPRFGPLTGRANMGCDRPRIGLGQTHGICCVKMATGQLVVLLPACQLACGLIRLAPGTLQLHSAACSRNFESGEA